MTNTPSLKLSVLLCAVTASQLAASLGMQWFAIASLGAGIQTDALLAGMTLPLLCITLGVESLTFVLTPMLAIQPDSKRCNYVWQLIATAGLLSFAAAIILGLAAPLFVPLIVPGFNGEARALTILLTRVQLGTILGSAWYAILAGLCQARGQFLRPPIAALACLLIAWMMLGWRLHTDGVVFAAWMQVAVYVGPALVLLPSAGRPTFADGWRGELPELWIRLRPVLAAATYCRSGFVVDRYLASFAGPGSLAILDLGQRVHGAAVRVMNETLVTPQVSTLARFAATKQWEALQTMYRRQRWRVTIAAGALTSVIVVIATSGQPWLSLLASSPQTVDTIRRLLPVLGCLSGIAATASLSHSLTTAFYAIGDTHTPSRVGAAMYTVGLAAKIAGAIGGGLQGIALAITATHVCNWLALEYAWARGLAGPLPRPSAATT